MDACCARPFGDNGCGIALPDDTRVAFRDETSLVECALTGQSDIADVTDVHVRYDLASGAALLADAVRPAQPWRSHKPVGLSMATCLAVETGGLFRVGCNDRMVPGFGAAVAPDMVAGTIGLSVEEIIRTLPVAWTRPPFAITILKLKDARG
ncbi:MAG: hypothetical protein GDA36_04745 [Rhodobacteraceae bacterium]|nr:hypothetical protein [Paracoccaceae bacterium]